MEKDLTYILLGIPLVILVSLAIFHTVFGTSQAQFEETVTNESLGVVSSSPINYTTDYPAKIGTITAYVVNRTNGVALVTGTEANFTYYNDGGLTVATVQTAATNTSSNMTVYANYTAYSKQGYTENVDTYTTALDGYKISALVPFVMIAMLVLGAVLGIMYLKA